MKRLELLDYGRFFAALFVILYHYSFNGISNGKISTITYNPAVVEIAKYGYLGVEFFFMISGYVIFFSAQGKAASQFAVSRGIRLFPAFWVAVLFTSLFALVWGGPEMSVTWKQILVNMTMIPTVFGVEYIDGVYWTLMYELTFYSGIFVLLLFGFKEKLNGLILLWPPVFVVALLFDKDWIPFLGGYYYYFAAGALFAVLKNQRGIFPVVGLGLVYALCIHHSAGNTELLEASRGVDYSAEVISVIILGFYLLFAIMGTEFGSRLQLPQSRLLGGLTYPIYLVHAHFGYMVINRFANEDNKYQVYLITTLIVLLVAYLIHALVEARLAVFWKKFFTNTLGRPIGLIEEALNKAVVNFKRMLVRSN